MPSSLRVASAAMMHVTLGDGAAVIRRSNSSAVIVANILGQETHGSIEKVFLDRLVHDESEHWGEWTAEGAVSTILTRHAPTSEEENEL